MPPTESDSAPPPSPHRGALAGRVALITGGGTGIGRAIAAELAAAGAAVAISGRRGEVLERTARELGASGATVLPVTADVTAPAACREAVAAVVDRLGALHILVNNAGVARGGPVEALGDDEVELLVDVDLKGPIHAIRAALPQLRRHRDDGGASILNISSSVTLGPIKNFSVYSAAKAGLDMMTRCLALELAPDRIRVNSLCPGIVETPIFETMMEREQIDDFLTGMARAIPLGRVATPLDVARLARHLLSPAGEYVTGAVIPVDGGLALAADGKG